MQTQEKPVIVITGGGGDHPRPPIEIGQRNGDGENDDYVAAGVMEAELFASAARTVGEVNRGVRRFEHFNHTDLSKSTKIAGFLGVIIGRREVPKFLA